MQLSIIIVSFNVRFFLEQCLHSVRRAVAGLEAEIIIVDNASSDGSVAYLQPLFPEVIFFAEKDNLGFSKACNLGLQHARGSYVLFLNPDVLLAEDSLHICLHFAQNKSAVGGIGVRMIDGAGVFLKESKRGFPGLRTSFFKMAGLHLLFPRSQFFSSYYLGHLPEHRTSEVDVLAGAFMLIPRKVLDQVGAFDEAFFMYGEDIDLSYRMQQAGFRNYYVADTTIIHFKGESTAKESLQYVRHFYTAMAIFFRKHYGGKSAGLLHILVRSAIGIRAAVAAVGRVLPRSNKHEHRKQLQENKMMNKQEIAVAASQEMYPELSRRLAQVGYRCVPVSNLSVAAELTKGKCLLLCTGDAHSYKQIIAQMQLYAHQTSFLFHAAGSYSIVGSHSSTSSGIAIAL